MSEEEANISIEWERRSQLNPHTNEHISLWFHKTTGCFSITPVYCPQYLDEFLKKMIKKRINRHDLDGFLSSLGDLQTFNQIKQDLRSIDLVHYRNNNDYEDPAVYLQQLANSNNVTYQCTEGNIPTSTNMNEMAKKPSPKKPTPEVRERPSPKESTNTSPIIKADQKKDSQNGAKKQNLVTKYRLTEHSKLEKYDINGKNAKSLIHELFQKIFRIKIRFDCSPTEEFMKNNKLKPSFKGSLIIENVPVFTSIGSRKKDVLTRVCEKAIKELFPTIYQKLKVNTTSSSGEQENPKENEQDEEESKEILARAEGIQEEEPVNLVNPVGPNEIIIEENEPKTPPRSTNQPAPCEVQENVEGPSPEIQPQMIEVVEKSAEQSHPAIQPESNGEIFKNIECEDQDPIKKPEIQERGLDSPIYQGIPHERQSPPFNQSIDPFQLNQEDLYLHELLNGFNPDGIFPLQNPGEEVSAFHAPEIQNEERKIEVELPASTPLVQAKDQNQGQSKMSRKNRPKDKGDEGEQEKELGKTFDMKKATIYELVNSKLTQQQKKEIRDLFSVFLKKRAEREQDFEEIKLISPQGENIIIFGNKAKEDFVYFGGQRADLDSEKVKLLYLTIMAKECYSFEVLVTKIINLPGSTSNKPLGPSKKEVKKIPSSAMGKKLVQDVIENDGNHEYSALGDFHEFLTKRKRQDLETKNGNGDRPQRFEATGRNNGQESHRRPHPVSHSPDHEALRNGQNNNGQGMRHQQIDPRDQVITRKSTRQQEQTSNQNRRGNTFTGNPSQPPVYGQQKPIRVKSKVSLSHIFDEDSLNQSNDNGNHRERQSSRETYQTRKSNGKNNDSSNMKMREDIIILSD